MYKNSLIDVLHNLSMSENNNANITQEQREYYKGLLVGCMAGLRRFYTWNSAIELMCASLPYDCVNLSGILPPSWKDDFSQYCN